jgi:hypothetical protein
MDHIDFAIQVLNDALKADPLSMKILFSTRVPINKDLSDHPTIQTRDVDGAYSLSILGLINGLFGIQKDGWGHIAMMVDFDSGDILGFERLNRSK